MPISRRIASVLFSEWVLIATYMVFAGILSLRLGQDANWDLLNYHFYNPYLLLQKRLDVDMLPAGVQTYINPTIDIPFYLAAHLWNIPPIILGFVLGAVHGLSLWLVHKIVVLLFPGKNRFLAFLGGITAAVTGAFGAGYYGEIGSTMGDNLMCVFVLGALVILLGEVSSERGPSARSASAAGFLIGLATGFKLVAAIYAVGLAVAGIAAGRLWRERFAWVFRFAVLAAVGMIVSEGYWAWQVFTHFRNPLFPYYNAIFGSPFAPAENLFDSRFFPRTALQSAFYPFLFAQRQNLAVELNFADGRLAVAYVCLIAFGAIAVVRRWKNRKAVDTVSCNRLTAIAVFSVVSYIVWLETFSYYRYAIPLEILSSAILIACSVYIVPNPRRAVPVAVAICIALIANTEPLRWQRVPFAPTYFTVDAKALAKYENSTILLVDQPNAYLIPFFPTSATFLRVSRVWDLNRDGAPLWKELQMRVRDTSSEHLFVLLTPTDAIAERRAEALERIGLRVDGSRCQEIPTVVETGRICRLMSIASSTDVERARGQETN